MKITIQDKIKNIHKRIEQSELQFYIQKEILEKELNSLYEELYEIKVGDTVKIAQITVRDIHRDLDIEILGKTGTVSKVESEWITVKIGGFSYALSSKNLEKI